MSFKRSERLGSAVESFRASGRASSPFFYVKWSKNGDTRRVAILVGGKTDRRATRRNLLRRRASAILERELKTPRDVVVGILPAANGLSGEDFARELKKLL